MLPSRPLLIATNINEELKSVRALMGAKQEKQAGAVAVHSGKISEIAVDAFLTCMGTEAAKRTSEVVLNGDQYCGILVVGFCGGLSLTLKNGDVVIPNRVISSLDDFIFDMDLAIVEDMGRLLVQEGLRYRAVPLITANRVLETPGQKRLLFEQTHAEAVDMESSEIVRVARRKLVKAAVIKVVIDDVETEIPPINELIKRTGKMDQLTVTKSLVSHPALSMQLSKNIKRARAVLEIVLPKMAPMLHKYWNT